MFPQWLAGFLLENVENFIGIFGVIFATFGSLIVIYPDIENKFITGIIKTQRVAPKVKSIEVAWNAYRENGVVKDSDGLDPVIEYAEVKYTKDKTSAYQAELFGGFDSIERIEKNQGRVVGYDSDDRKFKSGPEEEGAASLAAYLLFSGALQRYCRQRGMTFMAVGFLLLLISYLLAIAV